ncbi:MAG: CotH kinase family protein, partial [Oscillospiraceae bacterium]|nr:CotH kinase family protein [Oscillospiraceae bacterium]
NGPDNTQLRTHMAMDFNRRMNTNMHYVSIAQPVHVYVNGEYVGIYTLTDERDASPGRMDLHLRENPADSDFFVEYCFRIPEPGDVEGNHFVKVNGRGYDIRFPENGAQRREHAPYIQAYLYRVSEAIRARDFDALTSLIEVSTFVDYYIILEFFHNLTHQHSNVLMSLSGEGDQRLLRMGPIWDFDSYFQDLPYNLDQLVCPTSSIISQRDPNYYFYWFGNLVRIPEFAELVRERWAQLRADGIPQQSIDQMRHMAETYRADFERYRGDAIFNAVQEHTEWFEARMEWLDDNMPPNFTQPQRTISWVNVLGIAGIVTLSVLNVFAIIWFLRILFAT